MATQLSWEGELIRIPDPSDTGVSYYYQVIFEKFS